MDDIRNQQKNKVNQGYIKTAELCNVYVGAFNTIVGNMIFDSIDMLKKRTNLYKGRVKYYGNLAYGVYEKYEKLHSSNFGDRYHVFLTYLDNVEEMIRRDIDILVITIKNILDKHNESLSDVKAYIEATRVMIELSCDAFDSLMRQSYKHFGVDYTRWFSAGRLKGCLTFFSNVSSDVCRSNNIALHDELKNNEIINRSLEVILNKISNEDFLNMAGYITLKQCKGELEKFTEEELKYLEEHYGK